MRSLNQIWADATSLARVVEETADQLPRYVPAQTDTPILLGEVVIPHRIEKRRELARTKTRNELVAGRLVGLGRLPDSNEIERVGESFWIGAEIDWSGESATRDGKRIIEIRVVSAEVLAPAQTTTQQGPGRPSEREIICRAIADYAKRNRGLRGTPAVRHEVYRSFISDQGYNPQDPGFTRKTFESYEREYRKGNKQLFPD